MTKRRTQRTKLILVLILLVAFLLRLTALGAEDIWIDEAYSAAESQHGIARIWNSNDPTPPLYYVFLYFWMGLFGSSVFMLRLLSVFFGTLLVLAGYALARHHYDEKTGLLAAALLACSPGLIAASQNARSYALFFLLATLSTYMYVRWKERDAAGTRGWYILTSTAMLYTHPFGVFVLLAQNLHFFTVIAHSEKKEAKKEAKRQEPKQGIAGWAGIQAAIFLLFVPWLLRLPGIIQTGTLGWLPRPTLAYGITTTLTLIEGTIYSRIGAVTGVLVLGLLVLLLSQRSTDEKKGNADGLLLWYWLLASYLVPFILALIFIPVFTTRYVLIAAIPLLILASRAIITQKKTARNVLAVMLVTSLLLMSLFPLQSTMNPRWSEAAKVLEERRAADEPLIVLPAYEVLSLSYYLLPACFQATDRERCYQKKGLVALHSPEQARQLEGRDYWLVRTSGLTSQNIGLLMDTLQERYDIDSVRAHQSGQPTYAASSFLLGP
ncbi:MAG: phospholipid carrier-dependent glycosyltransferase [DPANN group archaeon]|nr:phospholipid carrier-dependent glycosyltransferase [DPANN group archaeon]